MTGGMRIAALFVVAVLGAALAACAHSQDSGAISTPHDNDEYSRLVAATEAGDTAVDFRALRLAWLESAARKGRAPIDGLTKTMLQAAQARENAKVRDTARAILSIDYTNLAAHKYLRQACKILREDSCSDHEHFVEFGLLRSITTAGDGKSMQSAWKVISIDEEYFIMSMLDLRLEMQSLISDNGRAYDQMNVVDQDGAKKVLYFNISDFIGRELQ